jgi:dsRNA-specific ribonuclease
MDMLEPTENERAVMVILGYTFNNVQLLRTALQTWSPVFPYGNKRLALVGDKVLGLEFHLDGYPTTDNCGKHFTT